MCLVTFKHVLCQFVEKLTVLCISCFIDLFYVVVSVFLAWSLDVPGVISGLQITSNYRKFAVITSNLQ